MPHRSLGFESIDSEEHRALSLEAAEQGIVLLKNGNAGAAALPLSLTAGAVIAFIGPHHDATSAMLSSYAGDNRLVKLHSPLLAMQALANRSGATVTSARGCVIGGSCTKPMPIKRQSCALVNNDTSQIPAAVDVAAAADVAVVFVGLNQDQESEWGNPSQNDRQFLELPGAQTQLIKAVARVRSFFFGQLFRT